MLGLLLCLFNRLAVLGCLVWPVVLAQVCPIAVPENLLHEAEFLPADASTVYPEKTVTELLLRQPAEIQESIRFPQNEATANVSKDVYYVCPFCRYELPRTLWYFYYNNRTMKCFSLQPLYLTSCLTRLCRFFNTYNSCYRCVHEWSYHYFWAVCVDQSGNWWIRYLNKRLPTFCNCKRYILNPLEMCQVTADILSDRN
ncbi:hypothetical protein ACJMK2_009831 [Sinanodonta woodiana]|uniref:Uncharacterized protein n=1 Tax=Sinanodonta woodiana TaxID=1069815 RepID=A0ABD3VDI6_SINWO